MVPFFLIKKNEPMHFFHLVSKNGYIYICVYIYIYTHICMYVYNMTDIYFPAKRPYISAEGSKVTKSVLRQQRFAVFEK